MNLHDMTCTVKDHTLEILYAHGPAEKAVVDRFTGIITFHMRDGRTIYADTTKYVFPETSYLQQFGIGITEDGKLFFIQSWEKGLFCFEVESELLRWHYKRKKAYNLVVGKSSVICRFFDHSIEKLDIATGEVIACIPMGYGTNFHVLTTNLFLVGPQQKNTASLTIIYAKLPKFQKRK